MPKKHLLPPSGDSHKREVSVNLRFSLVDHLRLKQVAEFSGTTVANLLFYVTMNTTLPMMEQAVQRASKSEGSEVKQGIAAATSPLLEESIFIKAQDQEEP